MAGPSRKAPRMCLIIVLCASMPSMKMSKLEQELTVFVHDGCIKIVYELHKCQGEVVSSLHSVLAFVMIINYKIFDAIFYTIEYCVEDFDHNVV